ncbi:hypothetical protein CEUSTIGMA_g10518.t1 [Chlamydomonas eustigma]|uniref:CreA protein n=1 Tax=Chlamydomonas eustigma TaxID=1157962 RepID=A0A250XJK2_9CHLO|nr:hypothetical protein CEUSTIGMA_g10518.t1 [Chlamydomonas eustigma]|eukprot:GAX83092.1 hypothetical protein CEUSTIGMA_g10518.t1 [Chlamydomonas eustigma]
MLHMKTPNQRLTKSNRQRQKMLVQSHPRHSNIVLPLVASTTLLTLSFQGPAVAEKIGEFTGSGFLFKDNVEVMAVDDTEVEGVTLYLSDFQRNLVDKLKNDFFSDPSQTSVTCSITGPIRFKDPSKLKDKSGVEVFSERKSLNIFQDKTIRIRRLYDEKRNTLIYVAYSTRLSTASDDGGVTGGRYRTSVCALKLPDSAAPSLRTEP